MRIFLRDPGTIERVKPHQVLEENNIPLVAIATGQAALKDGLTFTHPEKKVREKAVERTLQHIEFAADFSSPVVIGLMRGNLPHASESEKEEAVLWTVQALQRCADFARKKG